MQCTHQTKSSDKIIHDFLFNNGCLEYLFKPPTSNRRCEEDCGHRQPIKFRSPTYHQINVSTKMIVLGIHGNGRENFIEFF